MIKKPNYEDAPKYCHFYFDLVKENDLIDAFKNGKEYGNNIMNSISIEKESYTYEIGKWNTKQVIQHIIDCERILIYRALRFSRNDNTELPGFDEDFYAKNDNTSSLNLNDLQKEFNVVRDSTIVLFENMNSDKLDFKALSNKLTYTPRSLGYMTAGHSLHHFNFINTKYLK